jgi:tRNA(fMet)-specific endonuclease VapC
VVLYVVDTDHVSMWLENQPDICRKAALHDQEIAITIVTVQEVFNGWTGRLNDPSQSNRQVALYAKLSRVVTFLKKVRVLDFDDEAERIFRQLLTTYPTLRKNRIQRDMRIAAIAIANDGIVVTRNQRDFSQIPKLNLQDWSYPNG